ncbi:MAG: hypothetical protein RLZZ234_277 [Candidatus Parcubacteria bacterium]
MKKFALFAMVALCTYAPQIAVADVVNFSMNADQQSLRDSAKKDSYTVGLSDKQVETQLKLICTAGTTSYFKRKDETCAISGTGAVVGGGKKHQRVQYAGGFIVKTDGHTDAGTMKVNYLAVGKVPASEGGFGGNLKLKPENPSSKTEVFKQSILKKIGGSSADGSLIDQRIDTIEFSAFAVPSSGMPSDRGCTWTGNMAFSYQTESWIIDVAATCSNKVYTLKGNMPWVESVGVENQTEYNLMLALPSANLTADEALFANPDGDADLFSAADGITGQIIMRQSSMVTTKVDGEDTEVPMLIDATGTLEGQNVPIETVRSLGMLIGVLSRTFFGA